LVGWSFVDFFNCFIVFLAMTCLLRLSAFRGTA
jgi:hypothetical protein